jgi:hypothetical protein
MRIVWLFLLAVCLALLVDADAVFAEVAPADSVAATVADSVSVKRPTFSMAPT